MTLRALVAALGGDLYGGGMRANVPAPGHSSNDRSISLWLDGGRLVIHGFGTVDWRAMRDDLRWRGLVDVEGRVRCEGVPGSSEPRPDRRARSAAASSLWETALPITATDVAAAHLRRRRVRCGSEAENLAFHPACPAAVYRGRGPRRPALLARISDANDRLTAVELNYLDPNGATATGLRLPRKTVGCVPAGAAVRLSPAAPRMLVGEGVATTLSAIDRFGLPGWALLSAGNLAAWSPPPEVRRVLIAADSGRVGEGAAQRLSRRLRGAGLSVVVRSPGPGFGDWNDAAPGRKEEGGRP